MRAIVVEQPGDPEVLKIVERPLPEVRPGWVLVRVRAFGLNRGELVTRAGGSGDLVTFPRVLGIECVGEVAEPSDSGLAAGQTVVCAVGGMGRDYDGGYQEYALLPASQVCPVTTTLSWAELGAIPEAFATAWGSLALLDLQPGQTLLVRGGTSSVGMAATTLAHARGVRVIATTRNESKRIGVEANGATVVIDDGRIAERVRALVPGGADALLELVGPATILDSFASLKPGAKGALVGYLADDWDVQRALDAAKAADVVLQRFSSTGVVNVGTYGATFQDVVDGAQSGRYRLNLDRTFAFDEISDAHRCMEANHATGKVVVTVSS